MKKGFVLFLLVAVVSLLGISAASAEVVRGKVVDLKDNKLSITTTNGESLVLSVDPEDFIAWKGDDEVDLKAVQVGSEAEVGYYADETGNKIASWIDMTPLAEGAEEEMSPEALGEEGEVGEETMEGVLPTEQPPVEAMPGTGESTEE